MENVSHNTSYDSADNEQTHNSQGYDADNYIQGDRERMTTPDIQFQFSENDPGNQEENLNNMFFEMQ